MEKADSNHTTSRLAELSVAHAQLRGMASVLARCALAGAPLSTWEAAALADSVLATLGTADRLLAEARGAHEQACPQRPLPLPASRLRLAAALVRSVAAEA